MAEYLSIFICCYPHFFHWTDNLYFLCSINHDTFCDDCTFTPIIARFTTAPLPIMALLITTASSTTAPSRTWASVDKMECLITVYRTTIDDKRIFDVTMFSKEVWWWNKVAWIDFQWRSRLSKALFGSIYSILASQRDSIVPTSFH